MPTSRCPHCHGNAAASSMFLLPAKGGLQALQRQCEPRRSPSHSKTPPLWSLTPQATALSSMIAKTKVFLQRTCLAATAQLTKMPYQPRGLRYPCGYRHAPQGAAAPASSPHSFHFRGLMSPRLSFLVLFTGFPLQIFYFGRSVANLH